MRLHGWCVRHITRLDKWKPRRKKGGCFFLGPPSSNSPAIVTTLEPIMPTVAGAGCKIDNVSAVLDAGDNGELVDVVGGFMGFVGLDITASRGTIVHKWPFHVVVAYVDILG
jgi:hypothetical protein